MTQDAKTEERPPVPGLTEDGYDYSIGGIIGVRVLLQYAMDGLQEAHDKLQGDRQAAVAAAKPDWEAWQARCWAAEQEADALRQQLAVAPMFPADLQAEDDRVLGAQVRFLNDSGGDWFEQDGLWIWISTVPTPVMLWSDSIMGLAEVVRARFREKPAPEPTVEQWMDMSSPPPDHWKAEPPTVPAGVAEDLRLAGAG